MKSRFLLLLIVFVINCLTVSAQSWVWGEPGYSINKNYVSSSNVATNRTGNVYRTGGFGTTANFGTYTVNSNGDNIYLIKYDKNGNLLWVKQSKTVIKPTSDLSVSVFVASDDSDNSYISGNLQEDTAIFGPDTLYGAYKTFLVKYDPNGNVLWAKQPFDSITQEYPNAIARDNFGHEYITGSQANLTKFDRNGNLIWTMTPINNNPGNNYLFTTSYSVATDISGNIYVSGQFQDSLIFGSYKLYSANPGIYIAKFDSNGNVLWANQSNNNPPFNPIAFGNSNGGGYYVTTDKSGAAYLTGPFINAISFGSYSFAVRSDIEYDFFVMKYNSDGNIAWGKQATPLNGNAWESYSICNDDSNYIYILGGGIRNSLTDKAFTFGNYALIANPIKNGSSESEAFLIKLDSSGNVICGSTLPKGSPDEGGYPSSSISVASDPTGKFIYFGGDNFGTPFAFQDDTIISQHGADFANYVGRWQCECDIAVTSAPTLQTICAGHTATLSASGTGAVFYSWSPAATLSSSTGDSVAAAPLATTTYVVTATNYLAGCKATGTDTIFVLQGINVPIITQDGNILTTSSTNNNQWYRNDSILTGETGRIDTVTEAGWYKVEAINPSNGCNTVSDSIYVNPTGIAPVSINKDQISVYPNPTTGNIILTINSSAEDVKDWTLVIRDVLGRMAYNLSSLNYTNNIDLSKLPGGVYFIAVVNEKGQTAIVPVLRQ